MKIRNPLFALATWLTVCPVFGQSGTVHLEIGTVIDRTPPSGPGINNPPIPPVPGQWTQGNVPRTFDLKDYRVVLLNDATVVGFARPVDGIVLSRIINQVTPMGGMIPPSTFNESTEIVLATENTGLFGPGATIKDWDRSFPLADGAFMKFSTSQSYYRGGGPFGGFGGMVYTATGYDATIRSFAFVPVPEPGPVGLAVLGLAGLGWSVWRRAGRS